MKNSDEPDNSNTEWICRAFWIIIWTQIRDKTQPNEEKEIANEAQDIES